MLAYGNPNRVATALDQTAKIKNTNHAWSIYFLSISRRYAYKGFGTGLGLHDFHTYLYRVRAIEFSVFIQDCIMGDGMTMLTDCIFFLFRSYK